MKPFDLNQEWPQSAKPHASRRWLLVGLTAIAAAALSACAVVGPDYVAPASTMPPAFKHATDNNVPLVKPPVLDAWWSNFHDAELNRIIDRVLAQNLDLAAALARVEQARAAANLAAANLLPQGSLSAQSASERQSLQSPIGDIGSHLPGYQRNVTLVDTGVGASWEVDLFGGLHRAHEADVAEAQAAEAERMGVRVSVAAEAADAYFRVRGAQARIGLSQDQIKTDQALLDLIDLRLKEGLSNRREQAEAQARLAQVRASIPPLRTELEIQLNRLDVLMGVQPGTYSTELSAPAAATSNAIPAIAAALKPEDLLRRRPDVIAAERRLAASNAKIGVAVSEYYPKFSLSALLGFESMNSVSLSGTTFQPQAVAGLHWRLFDFGRVDAEVAQAKGANAEALAHYRGAMLRATEDVENALVSQTQLDAERHELLAEVDADVRAREASEDAYKGGVSGVMEVLEQDRQLLTAKDQLAVIETGTARASVATFRALGGGW